MRPQDACELHEAGLLVVIEALIKRRAGIGDLLERRAAFGHGVGAAFQPVEWRSRRLLLAGQAGLHARDAQLRHVAQRLLERRPVFRLVRGEFETGFERGDPRVGEG